MSVLKYFKNTPGRPPIGRQALSEFFFKFAMRSLEIKKNPVARWVPPYISSSPPLPSSFEPENSTKNPEKKRGEEKESGEALPDSALVICRLVHLV